MQTMLLPGMSGCSAPFADPGTCCRGACSHVCTADMGMLAGLPAGDDIVVALPAIEDVPDRGMFPAFAAALEFAYTGEAHLQTQDVLPVWALAVALQVGLSSAVRLAMQSAMQSATLSAMADVIRCWTLQSCVHLQTQVVLPVWALAGALQMQHHPAPCTCSKICL